MEAFLMLGVDGRGRRPRAFRCASPLPGEEVEPILQNQNDAIKRYLFDT
ncbi:MAG: hypothetical protein V4801_11835 [Burkholderia gladioli]